MEEGVHDFDTLDGHFVLDYSSTQPNKHNQIFSFFFSFI